MNTLLHHDIGVCVLGSGSKGNATWIGDDRHGVLVDCGMSAKQILQRMAAAGLEGAPVDAVLLTHEHRDHVQGARVLAKRLARLQGGEPPPFYMSAGTHRRFPRGSLPETAPILHVQGGDVVEVGPLRLEAVDVEHDTAQPISWTASLRGVRVGVFTDLGRISATVARQVASVDVAVLEFNHDMERLLEGPYPWPLKERIRGARGHLSNAQAQHLLERVAMHSLRLEHVVLAHLSEENNTPELAHEAACQALHRAGRRDVSVEVAPQERPIEPIQRPGTPRIELTPPSQPQPELF